MLRIREKEPDYNNYDYIYEVLQALWRKDHVIARSEITIPEKDMPLGNHFGYLYVRDKQAIWDKTFKYYKHVTG